MFKIADESFADVVERFAAGEPFACRIASLYRSYPPALTFVDYWTIADDKTGAIAGAAVRNGADYVLLLTERADADEVCAFIRAVGARRVLCGAECGLEPDGYLCAEGPILKRCAPIEIDGALREGGFCVPKLKEAYALLESCAGDNFTVPDFENFYVDMNHRLRHKTTRICGIDRGGELAALCMTAAESENCAVVGAVACRPDLRRRGFGSRVTAEITNELIREGKTVYLHRANGENREFYESLGFEQAGLWREYFQAET